ALHVGDEEIELGAAERLDAARVVDHLGGQFGGGNAADADLRHAPGGRIERADIDGVRRPAAQGYRAKRARRERAACLHQELAAALPLRQNAVGAYSDVNNGLLAISCHAVSPSCDMIADFRPRDRLACCWLADRSAAKNCLQSSFQYYHHNWRFRCPG